MSNDKLILLDADVIIHFTKGDKFGLLTQHFKNRLLVLPEVLDELPVYKQANIAMNTLITLKLVKVFTCESSRYAEIMREYARIKKTHKSDRGESMCMAVARFEDKIIASSNRKDIDPYCKEHNITYMTTLDLLYELHMKGLISEADFDLFIYNVISQQSRLSHKNLQDYKKWLAQIA